MLTQERLKELLDYDPETGIFTWKRTYCGARKGKTLAPKQNGYIYIQIDGKRYLAHRLAWFWAYGEWPNYCVDHINANKCDNRITNLRDVTLSVNLHNNAHMKPFGVSGLKGVSWYERTKKWKARMRLNGHDIHIGYFNTPEEAHAAYLTEKRRFGVASEQHVS